MSRPVSNYKRILKLLEELHKNYPTFNLGRHLATALDDYGDVWGISDKELLFLLEKYKTALELDQLHIMDDAYVAKIVKDAENFDDILKEDDGDTD